VAVDELAAEVFGSAPEADEALAGLIAVGILCRADNEFPLLPARYHLALSGVEGVSVRLDSAHLECWAAPLAGGRAAGAPDDVFWPLLTCRNCGQSYVAAYTQGDRLTPRPETRQAERKVLPRRRRPCTWRCAPSKRVISPAQAS
jgi:hypothetical protein